MNEKKTLLSPKQAAGLPPRQRSLPLAPARGGARGDGRGAAAGPGPAPCVCQGRARRRLGWAPWDPRPFRCCPSSAAARCPRGCAGSDPRPLCGYGDPAPAPLGHPAIALTKTAPRLPRATSGARLSRAPPGAPPGAGLRTAACPQHRRRGATPRGSGARLAPHTPTPRCDLRPDMRNLHSKDTREKPPAVSTQSGCCRYARAGPRGARHRAGTPGGRTEEGEYYRPLGETPGPASRTVFEAVLRLRDRGGR